MNQEVSIFEIPDAIQYLDFVDTLCWVFSWSENKVRLILYFGAQSFHTNINASESHEGDEKLNETVINLTV